MSRVYQTFSSASYFDDRGPHGHATPITERVNVSAFELELLCVAKICLHSLIHDLSCHITLLWVSVHNITEYAACRFVLTCLIAFVRKDIL